LKFAVFYYPQDFQIQIRFILKVLVKTASWNSRILDNALNTGKVVTVFSEFFLRSPDNSALLFIR
jgi:hypothetical protein